MTYLSFLDRPRGREIARMNANPTSNTLSVEPADVLGGSGFSLLYRNTNLELANVTLSGALSITSEGYMDVVGGPQAGSISVTTDPSGNTYTDITQIRVKDDQGLFALNPATGIAEIQYANVNIIASQSLRGPNVFVDNIDVSEGSNVYYDAGFVHLFGTKGNPGVVNTGLDQQGSTLKISGVGVGQYLPSSITAPSWPGGGGPVYITPISATQPCTTQSNPVTGFTSPPLPPGDITVGGPTTIDGLNVPDRAALEIYGDAAGPVPYYAPGGFTPIQWYDKAPHTASKALVAQRNLHFSETEIEVTPPTGFLPADPFARNVLEVRNYAGPNVFAESYIGIFSKDAPWDTKLNRWEWKVHDNYNIDMLPNSYKSNINEVNKISHIVDYGSGKTHVSFATNLTGGTDVGFIFTPSGGTVNDPSIPPDGIFSLNIAANTIFDADKNELVVQRTKNASAPNSAALRVVGGLGVNRNTHFGDSIFINSNVFNDSVMTIRPHDLGVGFTEITYDSSNVFNLTVPHISALGSRQPTTMLSASSDRVILGNDIGFSDSTQIVRGDAFGRRTKITLTDDIDINSTTEQDLATNIYGYTSINPLIHCENDFVNFHANSFQIYSNLNTERPIANISQTDVIFGESSNNFSANFKLFSNSAYVFEQTGDHIKIGLQDTDEKAQMYINTTPMSQMYSAPVAAANTFNMWAQSGDGTVGDYRVLSTELRRTFLDAAPVAETGTTVTINPDATQYASLRIVNRNGDDVRFGGSPQADGFGDAITQFGMGLNFHSDTTANLTDGTTFQSRIAKSFVFDETENTLAWYPGGDSPLFSTLNYLLAADANGNVNTTINNITIENIQYSNTFEYSNVTNVFNVSQAGGVGFVNVGTSNRDTVIAGTSNPEGANTIPRVLTYVATYADGAVRSLMPTFTYHAYSKTIVDLTTVGALGNGIGPDNVISEISGSGTTRSLRYNGQNSGIIATRERLVFGLCFQNFDARSIPSYPESNDNDEQLPLPTFWSTDHDSSFGEVAVPFDCWVTSVTIKLPTEVHFVQGDTTWDGDYGTGFKGWCGFYLGSDAEVNNETSLSYLRNPDDVLRYLKLYQFPTNASNETLEIPGIIHVDLPSEEWVYVKAGDYLPRVKMTVYAGSDGAQWRTYTKVVNSSTGDRQVESGALYSATMTVVSKSARIAQSRSETLRWELPPSV